MRAVTRQEMQALDRIASETYGIPSLLLMENAGRASADLLNAMIQSRPGKIWIFCGKGNNGGDGLVVARHLWSRGYGVQILFAADPKMLKGDALTNWRIVESMGIPFEILGVSSLADGFRKKKQPGDWIVDALLGIGLERNIEGLLLEVIREINASDLKVIALDIPSGMDADTGCGRPVCVKAHLTLTMGFPKKGFSSDAAKTDLGEVHVIDIGLPRPLREGSFSERLDRAPGF